MPSTDWLCSVKEGREPSIPLTICAETFVRAKEYCDALSYSGPIALSCDETKLLSGLHLYWNPVDNTHYLVGSVNGPMKVLDPDQVKDLMGDSTTILGSKVVSITLDCYCS